MSATKRKPVRRSAKSATRKRAKETPKSEQALAERIPKAFAYLQQLDDLSRKRKARFEAFVDANRKLPSIKRAEQWLKFVLSDPENFGDQEAAIYVVSRSGDCGAAMQSINDYWKSHEQRVIKECAEGSAITRNGGRTTYVGRMSLSEARKIEERSPYQLRNFWGGQRSQELTIDATMLRTVEWCGIGGFEPWWKRLARQTTSDFVDGGLEPGALIYWLFAMSRSQLATKMMPKALRLALDNIELVRTGSHPWTQWGPTSRRRGRPNRFVYEEFEDIAYASALLFGNYRLRPSNERSDELLNAAAGLLQKHQRTDGSWPYWSHDKRPSVEATAMAVHALALHRPVGWERNTGRAAAWLEASQAEGGYWVEDSCPDPTYLTVLVLDALELAKGGKRVTFGPPSNPSVPVGFAKPREFRVALSFPGEARSKVKSVADKLQEKLGVGKVFYDDYFKHRLARPKLDIMLQSVYQKDSDLLVVWVSSDYAKKEWCCNVEWPAIMALIKERRADDVMFLSLDEGKPEGFLSNYGYVDVKDMAADEVVELILKRLEDHSPPHD